MIHGHGDDLYRSGNGVIANFSTNVWYEADCQLLDRLLLQHADRMLHYPEPDAGSFRQAVATYHNLSPEHVIAGNGATELFYLICRSINRDSDSFFPGIRRCLYVISSSH